MISHTFTMIPGIGHSEVVIKFTQNDIHMIPWFHDTPKFDG